LLFNLNCIQVMKHRPVQSGHNLLKCTDSELIMKLCSTCSEAWFIFITLQVINDLLDPTGQNLRIREDAQVPGVLVFIKIDSVIIQSCPFNLYRTMS